MLQNSHKPSIPLLLTQLSLIFMLIVSIVASIDLLSKMSSTNNLSEQNITVYARMICLIGFYIFTYWLILKRKRQGLAMIIIFYAYYLGKNIYNFYLFGLNDAPITNSGMFHITEAEKEGALFGQMYGPVFMSIIQTSFIVYFLFSKNIEKQFAANTNTN